MMLIRCLIAGILVLAGSEPARAEQKVCMKHKCLNVEIVDTAEAMRQGLQGRRSLAATRGMLFIFPSQDIQTLWMKDVSFPIDMIWVDSDRIVVYVEPRVPPCKVDPCPVYQAEEPAKYVLEAPAGFAERSGIRPGVKLSFKGIAQE